MIFLLDGRKGKWAVEIPALFHLMYLFQGFRFFFYFQPTPISMSKNRLRKSNLCSPETALHQTLKLRLCSKSLIFSRQVFSISLPPKYLLSVNIAGIYIDAQNIQDSSFSWFQHLGVFFLRFELCPFGSFHLDVVGSDPKMALSHH